MSKNKKSEKQKKTSAEVNENKSIQPDENKNITESIIIDEKNQEESVDVGMPKLVEEVDFHDKGFAVKFANFLLALSIICLVFAGIVAFSALGLVVYYLLVVCFMLITLFAFYKKATDLLERGGSFQKFLASGYSYFPYVLTGGIAFGVFALVLFISQKKYVHRTSKIITTCVILLLQIAVLIASLIINKNIN